MSVENPSANTPLLRWLIAGLGYVRRKDAFAAEYYVSPTGSDSGAGTQAARLPRFRRQTTPPRQGIPSGCVRNLNCTSQITLSKSGTSDTNRTQDLAYTGEVPILDFSNYSLPSGSFGQASNHRDRELDASEGLEIANGKVGSSGSHSYSMLRTKNASNNTFELLNIHNGFGPGFFVDTGTGGNLVLNCDSHDNYDVNGSQGDGQTATASVFTIKPPPSTIIRGLPLMAQLR